MAVVLQCGKCRHELIRETPTHSAVLTAHGEESQADPKPDGSKCSDVCQSSHWFLKDTAAPWISDLISKAEWTKGKLNCPNCDARIGSFDFVSTSKCACRSHVLPAVHFVKSKVDSKLQGTDLLAALKK
ncbi:hypothetical protein ONE63_002941 [Megalurothrips usitatus]|uniref:E3 ubiquitin-protein ligase RNF180-like n=1 Tax=Megalurothrips usitatus TaxID=439358 RepID=A0AAV7X9Z6_9NEOP|nr:hypothetical protein ONE63_002941 [Megalurothrips usitatus]